MRKISKIFGNIYSLKTWSLLHMNDNAEEENGELAERN